MAASSKLDSKFQRGLEPVEAGQHGCSVWLLIVVNLAGKIAAILVGWATPAAALADSRHNDRDDRGRAQQTDRRDDHRDNDRRETDRRDSDRRDYDRHDDVRVRIDDRPAAETRVWVEPVYRTVDTQQWVAPVYRTVTDHVWHAPITRTECDRVWVPDKYTEVHSPFNAATPPQRVLIKKGHYEDRNREVVVKEGYYEDVCRQALVCDGHYEAVSRQELISAGHWEDCAVPTRDAGFHFDVHF